MTQKEKDLLLKDLCCRLSLYDSSYLMGDSIDWLNKNHFDYRAIIEKGLAIDATNLNIY